MVLKNETTIAFLWNLFERFSNQIIKFICGIIIARILVPSDYGKLAMLSIFLVVGQSFSEGGFLNALVQKNKFSKTDANNVFMFNLFVSCFFYILFFFMAPYISVFFNENALTKILRALSIIGILNAISIVPRAHLHVKLDFKTQAKGTTLAVIVSSVVGILSAYLNFGVWSLVFQLISLSFVNTFYLYLIVPWRPNFKFSINEFKDLFIFGSQILLSNLMDRVFNNIYNIVIAKNYNSFNLGLYNRAEQFCKLPASNIGGLIQNVNFPLLSKFKDNQTIYKNLYVMNSRLVCFLVSPVLMIIFFYSEDIILLTLTSKWIESALFLKWLAIVWLFYPINFLSMNIFLSRKKGKMYLKIEAVRKIISIILLIITYKYGIIYIIYGQLMSSILILVINFLLVENEIGYKFKSQLFDVISFMIIAFIATYSSKLIFIYFDNIIFQLLFALVFVTIVYITLTAILNPRNMWKQLKRMKDD